jgi:hypothetical protein
LKAVYHILVSSAETVAFITGFNWVQPAPPYLEAFLSYESELLINIAAIAAIAAADNTPGQGAASERTRLGFLRLDRLDINVIIGTGGIELSKEGLAFALANTRIARIARRRIAIFPGKSIIIEVKRRRRARRTRRSRRMIMRRRSDWRGSNDSGNGNGNRSNSFCEASVHDRRGA